MDEETREIARHLSLGQGNVTLWTKKRTPRLPAAHRNRKKRDLPERGERLHRSASGCRRRRAGDGRGLSAVRRARRGLTVEGAWERHPSHGEQFKASSAMRSLPVGEKHIYEYLASGAVRGIYSATAAVLVNRFGSHTLEILSDSPEKLAEIKGISARRARDISETFRRQTGMRLLMEFLAANGLKPEYAMRLYKLYGDGALELVKSNPYVIASDRIGGQFDEADALALSLGFEEDSPRASPRRSF